MTKKQNLVIGMAIVTILVVMVASLFNAVNSIQANAEQEVSIININKVHAGVHVRDYILENSEDFGIVEDYLLDGKNIYVEVTNFETDYSNGDTLVNFNIHPVDTNGDIYWNCCFGKDWQINYSDVDKFGCC